MILESVFTMDKLPALSFKSKYASLTPPQTPPSAKYGSTSLGGDEGVNPEKSQGETLCCCICRQQFEERKDLYLHQKVCCEAAASYVNPFVPVNNDSSVNSQPLVEKNRLNNFSGHCTRNQRRMFKAFAQKKAKQRKLRTLHEFSSLKTVHAFWASKRTCMASPEPHPARYSSQESFFKTLDLVTNSSANHLKRKAGNHGDVDLDCQIVAVEGPISGEPFHSPRTTRSLMSQLSRESAETAKKRLNFQLDNEDANENEIFDSAAARRTTQASLLAIDFSSLLGQRLKKHMKSDLVIPPIIDIEQYCSTVPVLDEITAKLRHRTSDYPIMHRKRKGIVTGYCHTFKFNCAERREFIRTLRTGLNARSRRLLQQTRKCSVRLKRLGAEVIRKWTVKRMTIVNQEIAIDDDISIVQVDVPEHFFNQMQKMPVPSCSRGLCKQSHFGTQHQNPRQVAFPSTFQGVGVSGDQHPIPPYPYPTSSMKTSPTGPLPQFLVKQVSKNWTETGQESQKLVFVPLEELSSSQHPNIQVADRSVRGMSAGSSQRPHSSGIQKALPRHLRPCPKSRRKQLMPEREDSSDEFTVQTASSSSDEESKPGEKQRKPQEMVYPLSIIKAVDNMPPISPWMVRDDPVPQMLHIPNATSAATSIPLSSFSAATSSLPLLAQHLQNNPSGALPRHLADAQQLNSHGVGTSQRHFADAQPLNNRGVGTDQRQLVEIRQQPVPSLSASDNHSELRKQLSVFNLTPASTGPRAEKVEDKDTGPDCVKADADSTCSPQLSIGAVYGAEDLGNEQLAASLGLQCAQTAVSRQMASAPQSSLLQSRFQSGLDAGLQNHLRHPVQQSSAHQLPPQQPRMPQHVISLRYNSSQPCRLPVAASSNSHHQQSHMRNSSGYHPSIMRGPRRPLSSSSATPTGPSAATKPPSAGTKPSFAGAHSKRDWTVVRASDEDVVEVICIDDDDD